MPAPLDRSYDPHFGKPTWVRRCGGQASGYNIFIGDLPPDLTQAHFRRRWLVNSRTLVRALNTLNTDGPPPHRPWLFNINLRQAPNGDNMALLTFSGQKPTAAQACMEVILQWWRPYLEGGWEPMKVKWPMATN